MKNPYKTTMGQERLDCLSLRCIDADMLRSVDEDVIKDFALAKSRKRTFWIVYCIAVANVCRDVNETLACESVNIITMYVQFCNEAKSCAYWLVNETLWYETEAFDFQSETRSRPRPSHVSTRPRRLETTSRDRLETETSRPRLHPWADAGSCWKRRSSRSRSSRVWF